jgi:hypothetical protein
MMATLALALTRSPIPPDRDSLQSDSGCRSVDTAPETMMTNKIPNPLPNPADPSGSTGRPTFDPTNPGKYAGQDRYGQSGFAGGKPKETDGQVKYRQSQNQGDASSKQESNKGSGRADADETTKDVPKTG